MMKKRLFSLILVLLCSALLLAGCSKGSAPSYETWQQQYDLGVRYLSDGNYEKAILAFTAAIELDSSRAEAYIGRGDAYLAAGDTAAAREDYTKAEALAPDTEGLQERLDSLAPQSPPAPRTLSSAIGYMGDVKQQYTFVYDEAGHLTQNISEQWDPAGAPYGDYYSFVHEQYTYNAAGQKTAHQLTASMFGGNSTEYTYNDLGQLTQTVRTHVGKEVTTYQYNDAGDLIRSVSEYDYDEAQVCEYVYDDDHRLIQTVTPQATLICQYDDQGRLIREDADGLTYYYDYTQPHLTVRTSIYDAVALLYDNTALVTLGLATDLQFETDDEGYVTRVSYTSDQGIACYFQLFYDEHHISVSTDTLWERLASQQEN